jgi:hypothetical protein
MAGAVFQTWLPIVGGVVLLESTATAFKEGRFGNWSS